MKKTSLLKRIAAYPYILWSAIFILAPLIMVAYYAFTDRDGGFTLENILLIGDYLDIFMRSIALGAAATAICLILAYPFSYILVQMKLSWQKTAVILVMLPMWMNFLLRTYSWMTIIEEKGIINNLLEMLGIGPFHMVNTVGAVIMGMVYNFIPYMILPLYTVMEKLDRKYIEAASDLGADGFSVLKKIILPLTMPGIVSGITMVFVPSVSTFYISQKLGGGKFMLIGDVIEMQFQTSYNYNLGASLSLILMVLILICLAVMNRFTDEDTEVVV